MDLLVSASDLQSLVNASIPTVDELRTEGLLSNAVGYALQLAVLCYLDTLLTSLVVDKMVQERDDSNETTNKAKELFAQGLANGVVAIFGGLPGAQATIRSVLILKEGGTKRLAGIAAGMHVCKFLGVQVYLCFHGRASCMHTLSDRSVHSDGKIRDMQ